MPAVDGLASRGVRFTHARSVVPLTLPSHTSIMTGILPPVTVFGSTGRRAFRHADDRSGLPRWRLPTGAFVGAYVLDRRFGLADGFDIYDDRVERDPSGSQQLEAQRRGDAVVDAALKWLSASAAGAARSRPFFAWVHLYDPHAPYEPPPEYPGEGGAQRLRRRGGVR